MFTTVLALGSPVPLGCSVCARKQPQQVAVKMEFKVRLSAARMDVPSVGKVSLGSKFELPGFFSLPESTRK